MSGKKIFQQSVHIVHGFQPDAGLQLLLHRSWQHQDRAGEYLAGCGVLIFPHGQAPVVDAQQKTQSHDAGKQLREHSLLHISYLLSEWIVSGLCVQYNVCRAGRPIPGGFTQNFRGF